jgi:hypothetical protein
LNTGFLTNKENALTINSVNIKYWQILLKDRLATRKRSSCVDFMCVVKQWRRDYLFANAILFSHM